MYAIGIVGLLALCLAASARADGPQKASPMVTQCLAESGADELKACVRQLVEIDALNLELRSLYRSKLLVCMARDSVEAMRACMGELASNIAPKTEETERSETLKKAMRTWEVRRDASRMDSSMRVFLTLESDDEIDIGYGRRGRPLLVLRCIENTTAALVNADWYLDDTSSVQYRIDQEKPVAQTWQASTNHKSVGLWDGGRSIPLIKSLLGKKTFLIRLTTYSNGAKEMAFNIEGLDKVIEPLRTACKW